MTYAIVIKPHHNIAFIDQYLNMCQIELAAIFTKNPDGLTSSRIECISKVNYLVFDTLSVLTDEEKNGMMKLSFFYGLYEVDESFSLKPIVATFQSDFDDDLSMRLKYNGKTNEAITGMMINLAYYNVLTDMNEIPNLMDPLCGRGTTLFEGMKRHMNVFGIERDSKSVMEMNTYITRYVKEARFKHKNHHGKQLHGGKQIGEFFQLEYAKEKEDYKKDRTRIMKVFKGDATSMEGLMRKGTIDMIVTDFPYNVAHRGKGTDPKDGLAPLLTSGLKMWDIYLKRGGVVALSWNIYTDKRTRFEEIFQEAGYEVLKVGGLDQLEHRVAQAITRDIILARKLK